jgi:N-acetylmuramoyl-L-alanine amidase
MGFLTSAADRTLLVGQPDVPAAGIANGIIRYLNERDPSDTAALLPPNFQTQQPAGSDGATVRAAPSDDARVLFLAPAGSRLIPFQERDGWYQVVVRGNWNVVGWVKRHEVQPSGDPLPTS